MIAVRGIEAATGLRPDGGEISGMIPGVRIITDQVHGGEAEPGQGQAKGTPDIVELLPQEGHPLHLADPLHPDAGLRRIIGGHPTVTDFHPRVDGSLDRHRVPEGPDLLCQGPSLLE